jgi:ATP-dependent DNA helicase RecG
VYCTGASIPVSLRRKYLLFCGKLKSILQDDFDARKYMAMVIEVMNKSIQEPRGDKISPKIGALLIKPTGEVETAFRGELRHGDHAEFTLLERKNRSVPVDGSILFAILEPCAPGARNHPKLSCSERIVNARIKKVWIGIEDPDPTVDRKGIKYLIDNGVEVEMFDVDFQAIIREANKQFIREAEERAKNPKTERPDIILSQKEKAAPHASFEDFSVKDIENFLKMAKPDILIKTPQFYRMFSQLGLIEEKENEFVPTGLGLLLFGTQPQYLYPNALIRATYKTGGRKEEIYTVEGALVNQANDILQWYENHIGKQIDRSEAQRKTIYDYPKNPIRESVINAISHRDYDLEGVPVYFEINDAAIIIKSPGLPVAPIKIEQIQQFNAPSLSRNPKIMYVFEQMNLVEQRGLGFQTINELPKYGLPLPIVTLDDPYIVFTFPRSMEALKEVAGNDKLKELNADELRGYDYIRQIKKITRKEYENHFEYDTKKAERHLKRMTELALIRRKGKGPDTHYEF